MNGFSNAKGQIDLRAVRDAKFRLTGIEKVPVEESDNRTREWSRNTDAIAALTRRAIRPGWTTA